MITNRSEIAFSHANICYMLATEHLWWLLVSASLLGRSNVQLVEPWENKPLIQTCNQFHSLCRHNITTINCGIEFASFCKVNSSFF